MIITLADLDNLIENRLRWITFDAEPITVYTYIPDREKGDTVYPCIAFQRLMHRVIDEDQRSHIPFFIPSDEEQTIDVQAYMGGGQITGPVSYTVKPWPTPVVVTYEIQTLATKKTHADYLLMAMLSAIPPDYSPSIGGCAPMFCHDKPIVLDDLAKPEFRTSYLYDVRPVWIDRIEAWSAAPITTINTVDE